MTSLPAVLEGVFGLGNVIFHLPVGSAVLFVLQISLNGAAEMNQSGTRWHEALLHYSQ